MAAPTLSLQPGAWWGLRSSGRPWAGAGIPTRRRATGKRAARCLLAPASRTPSSTRLAGAQRSHRLGLERLRLPGDGVRPGPFGEGVAGEVRQDRLRQGRGRRLRNSSQRAHPYRVRRRRQRRLRRIRKRLSGDGLRSRWACRLGAVGEHSRRGWVRQGRPSDGCQRAHLRWRGRVRQGGLGGSWSCGLRDERANGSGLATESPGSSARLPSRSIMFAAVGRSWSRRCGSERLRLPGDGLRSWSRRCCSSASLTQETGAGIAGAIGWGIRERSRRVWLRQGWDVRGGHRHQVHLQRLREDGYAVAGLVGSGPSASVFSGPAMGSPVLRARGREQRSTFAPGVELQGSPRAAPMRSSSSRAGSARLERPPRGRARASMSRVVSARLGQLATASAPSPPSTPTRRLATEPLAGRCRAQRQHPR